jgi:two-component system sensor histidine kinase QseC
MKSIRRHLTRHLVGATCVLLGGGLLAVYLVARDALIDQFDDTLRAKALAISTVTRLGEDGVRVDFHDRFLRGFDDDRARDFFQLWDEGGETVARSESLGRRRELEWRRGKPDKPSFWNTALPSGEPGRAIAFTFEPPRDSGARRGKVALRLAVASEREDLDEELARLLLLSSGSGVLLIGATIVLIPLVLRRGLQPLENLADQTARIDAATLGTRFPTPDLPGELQPIASRLNELLSRLELSFERERRFSADLAHELRTPLAELRSTAECALRWPETRTAATDRETLAIAQQMEALVTQMLALTRGEQGQLAPRLEPVKLDQLFSEVWRPFASRAKQRKLAVSLDLRPVEVTADPGLLRSILTNLAANAVEYAPPGSDIAVRIEPEATGVSLCLSNPVEDLAPGDVERMFDRFWRKQSARGGPHLGLGLSLAQNFAVAMNWTLRAELDDGRLTIRLTGPAAPRPA